MQWKNTTLLVVAVIFSLAILELGLRIGTDHPVSRSSNTVKHPALGYVMSSRLAGIDHDGFRNPPARKANIAAIGDSHTYGYNVISEQSWPARLGEATGKEVYNFGVGGYGILQYAVLVDMAMAKKPEAILIGLYLKNDLATMCEDAARNKYWQEHRADFGIDLGCDELPEKGKRMGVARSLGRWVKENLAGVSILSDYFSRQAMLKKIKQGDSEEALVVEHGLMTTLIQQTRISLHADSLDLTRPQIAQAFNVLKQILRQTADKTRQQKIRFGVLLIPSKELVLYRTLILQGRKLSKDYERLVQNEEHLKRLVAELLTAQGATVADVLPEMEKALSRQEIIYPPQYDGHTLEPGYRAYAAAARTLLQ